MEVRDFDEMSPPTLTPRDANHAFDWLIAAG